MDHYSISFSSTVFNKELLILINYHDIFDKIVYKCLKKIFTYTVKRFRETSVVFSD